MKNKKVYIDWESHANFLWMLLDDAATAGDVAKGDNAWYRKHVESINKKRWEVIENELEDAEGNLIWKEKKDETGIKFKRRNSMEKTNRLYCNNEHVGYMCLGCNKIKGIEGEESDLCKECYLALHSDEKRIAHIRSRLKKINDEQALIIVEKDEVIAKLYRVIDNMVRIGEGTLNAEEGDDGGM